MAFLSIYDCLKPTSCIEMYTDVINSGDKSYFTIFTIYVLIIYYLLYLTLTGQSGLPIFTWINKLV